MGLVKIGHLQMPGNGSPLRSDFLSHRHIWSGLGGLTPCVVSGRFQLTLPTTVWNHFWPMFQHHLKRPHWEAVSHSHKFCCSFFFAKRNNFNSLAQNYFSKQLFCFKTCIISTGKIIIFLFIPIFHNIWICLIIVFPINFNW